MAAIHDQPNPSHRRAGIGGQQQQSPVQILRVAKTARRDTLEDGYRELIIRLRQRHQRCGLLHAPGARFLSADGEALAPTPAALAKVTRIDVSNLDARLQQCRTRIACGVTPLLGPHGATVTCGPQKGATPAQLTELESLLARASEHALQVSCRPRRECMIDAIAAMAFWHAATNTMPHPIPFIIKRSLSSVL